MSILNDPRVTARSDGYAISTDNGPIYALPNDALGWGLYHGPRLDMVMNLSGPAIGLASAEAAVEAVLR
jgi:hypothetical protein